jgi:hypothetical protein
MTHPLAPPTRAPSERRGERLFAWTQARATPGIVALGSVMATATLIALEFLAPRQFTGAAFDWGIGTFAAFGAVGATLLVFLAALVRRIPGAMATDDDDAGQP